METMVFVVCNQRKVERIFHIGRGSYGTSLHSEKGREA